MSNGSSDYLGVEIGNYRIAKKIDEGGSRTVYLAEHYILKEPLAAITLLHTHLITSEDQERFLRKAQLLERLRHAHILPIYDGGFDGQRSETVMRY
jgi:serine/threonine-protein kinase